VLQLGVSIGTKVLQLSVEHAFVKRLQKRENCSLLIMALQKSYFFWVLQAGIIIYRGLYFGLYDTLKPMLLTGESECQVRKKMACSFGLLWKFILRQLAYL
jgi:hypothetical protein